MDPALWFEAETAIIEGELEIAEIMTELAEVDKAVNDMMAAIEELKDLPLEDMSLELTLNYTEALNAAINLKSKESLFDEMEDTARYTIQDLKEATDNGIEGTSDLQIQCEIVSRDGKSLIETVCKFAETMMHLAERMDALIVAQQDLDRAEEEVTTCLRKQKRKL